MHASIPREVGRRQTGESQKKCLEYETLDHFGVSREMFWIRQYVVCFWEEQLVARPALLLLSFQSVVFHYPKIIRKYSLRIIFGGPEKGPLTC